MAGDAAVSEYPRWPGRGVAAFSEQLSRLHQHEGSNYAHTELSATWGSLAFYPGQVIVLDGS